MNNRFLMAVVLVVGGSLGGALAAPATWSQTSAPPAYSTDIPEEQGAKSATAPGAQAVEVDDLSSGELRDKTVYDKNNEKIATIRDVTGTPGHARQAILRTGGVMGFGGKDVAIPLEQFSVEPDGRLVLNMTEDQLTLLPKTN